ncbi:MAG: HD domain-containing protein [Solirubrobacteraceae bacterium]|nr:HD domain-containing protein [Solirubrobacteraceae bacterium]
MLTDDNPLPDGIPEELRRQLEFVIEVDQMKSVIRQTSIATGERRENDAEHSWHLTLMALVFASRAKEPVDLVRVLSMLVVHDLVEIYAGDTPLHIVDDQQEARERDAADQLFPLLPGAQGQQLREAWEEFEAHETPEARFARSLDRMQPLLLEWMNRGVHWLEQGRTSSAARERLKVIDDGSPDLWTAALALIEEAESRGYLLDE